MSNSLAVATVTATLVHNLQPVAEAAVGGTLVTHVRPDSSATGTPAKRVNIFLYQVTPNAAMRNEDLATRGSDGGVVRRPRTALDLHYLFSFYGDEAQLEPQRMLGSIVSSLHARPVLTRQHIRDAISSSSFQFLASSDLADDVELVKFTPASMSLEDLSKLWSVFFQTQYALSVAYQATVVLIESDETLRIVPVVRERRVHGMPFNAPVIDRVSVQEKPSDPIVIGSKLEIRGNNLRGDTTWLRINGTLVAPEVVEDRRILVTLAQPQVAVDSLRSGAVGIQVVHGITLETPDDPHKGIESNVASFILYPQIVFAAGKYAIATADTENENGGNTKKGQINVSVEPVAGVRQRASLTLSELKPPESKPASFRFAAKERSTDTGDLQFPFNSLPPGSYLARVQLDGVETPVKVDVPNNDPRFGPVVSIP